jgi:hypothetical protein
MVTTRPPQFRDEAADLPKDPQGPLPFLWIFIPQVQALKSEVVAHLQGVQAQKGPSQLSLRRRAVRQVLQGESPVNALKTQVQGELPKLFHLGDKVAAGKKWVFHGNLIQNPTSLWKRRR